MSDQTKDTFFDSLKQKFSEDSLHILKLIAPTLLLISFFIVLIGWMNLKETEGLNQQIKTVLAVPLILFGISAILNIILFAQQGVSMVLSIFFIGSLVAGPEIAKTAAELTAKTVSDSASSIFGGLGSPMYESGGLEMSKPSVGVNIETEQEHIPAQEETR